jgi:hypothetical protein
LLTLLPGEEQKSRVGGRESVASGPEDAIKYSDYREVRADAHIVSGAAAK